MSVSGGQVYVRINGHLRVNGTFDPRRAPILLINSGPGANHAYLLSLTPLARDRAVILYDQLDTGLSDQPGSLANWTVERFVSEIEAVRTFLGLPQLHLLGHGWGGALALEYAARQPAGLQSLTLASPLISARSWNASITDQLAALPHSAQQAIRRHGSAGATDHPAYVQALNLFASHFCQRHPNPDWLTKYLEQRGLSDNPAIQRVMWGDDRIFITGTLQNYDAERSLSCVSVPTLFICGQHDKFPAAAAAPFAARVANATLMSVPAAGHMAMVEGQGLFISLMRQHVDNASLRAK